MDKVIKEFKSCSTAMIILALLQVNRIVALFHKLTDEVILNAIGNFDIASLGMTAESLIPILRICSFVPAILTVLVYTFLCIKGHKEANDPSPAKFHIILACIWVVFAAYSIVDGIVTLVIGSTDVMTTALEVVAYIATGLLLFYYAKLGLQVRKTEA